MAKSNDSDAAPRSPRRRRSDYRGPQKNFQWDSVDDQIQEDMLEPVEPPKTKKSRGRRPEHVADTRYVNASDSNDVFAPVKKRTVKVKQAKDYASFVAEVGDDEIDPYAIPSYGSTRLTHGTEVPRPRRILSPTRPTKILSVLSKKARRNVLKSLRSPLRGRQTRRRLRTAARRRKIPRPLRTSPT